MLKTVTLQQLLIYLNFPPIVLVKNHHSLSQRKVNPNSSYSNEPATFFNPLLQQLFKYLQFQEFLRSHMNSKLQIYIVESVRFKDLH